MERSIGWWVVFQTMNFDLCFRVEWGSYGAMQGPTSTVLCLFVIIGYNSQRTEFIHCHRLLRSEDWAYAWSLSMVKRFHFSMFNIFFVLNAENSDHPSRMIYQELRV